MNPYGTPAPGAIDLPHLPLGDSAYSAQDSQSFIVTDGLDNVIREHTNGRAEHPWEFRLASIPMWDKEIAATEEFLFRHNVTDRKIDEIALLFPNDEQADYWIGSAVAVDGIEHFNMSWDRVKTYPFNNEYSVRYDFLRLGKPYRVEAMRLPYGQVSPLHAPLVASAQRYEHPVPVHLSFKTHSEEEYQETLRCLDDAGFDSAQHCASTYGRFSYWRHAECDLYIKPRLNVRDAK